MRLSAGIAALLVAAIAVEASGVHDGISHLSGRHARLARRGSAANGKRCKAKPSTASSAAKPPPSVPPKNDSKAGGSNNAKAADPPKSSGSVTSTIEGLLHVKSTCGDIGASKTITATKGPNGSLDWLNCGINDGGWKPSYVAVSDLVAVDLSEAIKDKNSPFKACSDYVALFNKYGKQFDLPPIMLASFAMQESSCNPETIGGAGEQGLMQITKDKCNGAPEGDCKNPDFNIKTGAKYFSDNLKSNAGDVLLTIGQYNGWHRSMTYADATAAAKTDCCPCQNNLDYLHQFLNGWLQNKNSYDNKLRLGKYFNLDVCSPK